MVDLHHARFAKLVPTVNFRLLSIFVHTLLILADIKQPYNDGIVLQRMPCPIWSVVIRWCYPIKSEHLVGLCNVA